jgi:hypothetical protein
LANWHWPPHQVEKPTIALVGELRAPDQAEAPVGVAKTRAAPGVCHRTQDIVSMTDSDSFTKPLPNDESRMRYALGLEGGSSYQRPQQRDTDRRPRRFVKDGEVPVVFLTTSRDRGTSTATPVVLSFRPNPPRALRAFSEQQLHITTDGRIRGWGGPKSVEILIWMHAGTSYAPSHALKTRAQYAKMREKGKVDVQRMSDFAGGR